MPKNSSSFEIVDLSKDKDSSDKMNNEDSKIIDGIKTK